MSESKKRKQGDGGGDDAVLQWEDVKKARNRINSQRTRERERLQMESLEAEKTRLELSNDALRFQNSHFRESLRQIAEVVRIRRARAAGSGESGSSGVDANPQPNLISSLPVVSVDLATGTVGGRGYSAPERSPHRLPVDPLRYAGIEPQFGHYPGGIPVLGSSTLDGLRARHQAALEAEAALLQRHRAATGLGGLRAAPQMTQSSSLVGNRPARMLPSLDIMELRARQLRMQELELAGRGGVPADMMVQYPQGIPAPGGAPNPNVARDMLHEDSKQESKHTERKEMSRR